MNRILRTLLPRIGAILCGFTAAVSSLSIAEDRLAADRFVPEHDFGKQSADDMQVGFAKPWQLSEIRPAIFDDNAEPSSAEGFVPPVVIFGTNQRNNPLRRELRRTYAEDDLFVGFRFLYEPSKIDQGIDPEFFVLWLDRTQGSDQAVHSVGVPNIGIHMADRGPSRGKNVFMVRFGAQQTAWSRTEMEPGKTYHVIARLAKQTPGTRNGYSQIQLWVDPQADEADQPILSLNDQDGIHQIRWVGFATGGKTERQDRIRVGDLVLTRSWQDAYTFLSDSEGAESERIAASRPSVTWDQPIDFTHDIYPILRDRCFDCHSGDYPDSGYRLDVRNELLGFSTGHVFAIPGQAAKVIWWKY